MKKKLLLFLMISSASSLIAQNYMISFSGSGQSTIVDSVRVINLSQGTTLTLNGSDTLHLGGTVGIPEMRLNPDQMFIYPNPASEWVYVELNAVPNSYVQLNVADLLGRTVLQDVVKLNTGRERYSLSGLNRGVYIISANINGILSTERILIQSNSKFNPSFKEVDQAGNKQESGNEGIYKRFSGSVVSMNYIDGEVIMTTAYSSDYKTVKTFVPTESQTVNYNFVSCTDASGNSYSVVSIGRSVWMAENLKTTHFNDGTELPLITNNTEWLNATGPAYCWYENDFDTYGSVYGALYNGLIVETDNLCPAGWHLPSDSEWASLTGFFGPDSLVGGMLKETGFLHWNEPNTGATNVGGFTALPGGWRTDGGPFSAIRNYGYWLSSKDPQTLKVFPRGIGNESSSIDRYWYSPVSGFSVRCVKD
jgi:uncharacterized protein (TIGR02145 family)